MGSRMAANVRGAGFPLTVWTHTPGKAARWAAEHDALAVDTPAAVARASDIVVSMVVDGEQVASVLLGGEGVARGGRGAGPEGEDTGQSGEGVVSGAHPGLLCVDMSTIAPSDTRRIGATLGERGVRMLDAPVTGSSPRAEEGSLTIMAGGEAEDFARARPLLEAMGRVIVHVGALGQGEMLKLINNALGAANAAALAEALLLARASDLDLDAFAEVVSSGSGASAQLDAEGGGDARPRLHPPVQDRPHAQGRAPLPRGGPERGRPLPRGRPRPRPAHRHHGARARRRGLRRDDRGRRGSRGAATVGPLQAPS